MNYQKQITDVLDHIFCGELGETYREAKEKLIAITDAAYLEGERAALESYISVSKAAKLVNKTPDTVRKALKRNGIELVNGLVSKYLINTLDFGQVGRPQEKVTISVDEYETLKRRGKQ